MPCTSAVHVVACDCVSEHVIGSLGICSVIWELPASNLLSSADLANLRVVQQFDHECSLYASTR